MIEPLRLKDHPGFRRFWAASTISDFGTYITTLTVGVLVVVNLDGSAADVGWVNAARWAPYLVVGLLVGVLADRVRRKPLLVSTDLARACVLGAFPLFAVTDLVGRGARIPHGCIRPPLGLQRRRPPVVRTLGRRTRCRGQRGSLAASGFRLPTRR
ncbi:MAG: MFS transporter [Actinomycetota bacterium]|nr:MFS transporter [Actinomycetota bacterium]